VKYIAAVDGVEPRAPVQERCLFQNMATYPFHLPFLISLPGGEDLTFTDYTSLVLRRSTRAWWGGEVRFVSQPHPVTGANGVLMFALYTEDTAGNRLVVDDVLAVHTVLSRCAPTLAASFAFVPGNSEQTATARAEQATLAAAGIGVIFP
jgi:hypothetical protein